MIGDRRLLAQAAQLLVREPEPAVGDVALQDLHALAVEAGRRLTGAVGHPGLHEDGHALVGVATQQLRDHSGAYEPRKSGEEDEPRGHEGGSLSHLVRSRTARDPGGIAARDDRLVHARGRIPRDLGEEEPQQSADAVST